MLEIKSLFILQLGLRAVQELIVNNEVGLGQRAVGICH